MSTSRAPLELTPAAQEKLANELRELVFGLNTLAAQAACGELRHELSATILGVAELLVSEVATSLGVATQHNQKIAELQKAISAEKQVSATLKRGLFGKDPYLAIRRTLRDLENGLNVWWRQTGLGFVGPVTFSGTGCQLQLIISAPRTPDDDADALVTTFERETHPDDEGEVLDNDFNRSILLEYLKRRFPSAVVSGLKNRPGAEGAFYLSEVSLRIENLKELYQVT